MSSVWEANRRFDEIPIVAALKATDKAVEITWSDGHQSRFPLIWLRHNCFFGANPGGIPNKEGLMLPERPEDLAVSRLSLDGDELEIVWQGRDRPTRHQLGWLRANCLSDAARAARKHRPTTWSAEDAAGLRSFDWPSVRDNEDQRFALFRAVLDYGFARLKALPGSLQAFEELAALFGPIHESGYGRIFEVQTESHLALGATTAAFLGPHTDENYRHAPPGFSFFHCLVAHPDDGGESTLVDGFEAARRLREADPEAFKILSSVPLDFADTSPVHDYRARGRVICCDLEGDIVGIRFTDRTNPPPDLPEDLIEPVYRALRAYISELYNPELALSFMLAPGDVNIFDNQRVLHGRTAFDPSAGPRHLRNCAVDRDEFHHRLRLLARTRDPVLAEQVFAGGALG